MVCVTIYRWVQRFTPLLIDAARACRHAPGDRWFVDETSVKIAGRWVSLYRAIDQFGQVLDVLVAEKRDLVATRRFFTRVLDHGPHPSEVTTDRAPAYPRGRCCVDEFVQNLRRGHYELGVDAEPRHRLPAAFAELTLAI